MFLANIWLIFLGKLNKLIFDYDKGSQKWKEIFKLVEFIIILVFQTMKRDTYLGITKLEKVRFNNLKTLFFFLFFKDWVPGVYIYICILIKSLSKKKKRECGDNLSPCKEIKLLIIKWKTSNIQHECKII